MSENEKKKLQLRSTSPFCSGLALGQSPGDVPQSDLNARSRTCPVSPPIGEDGHHLVTRGLVGCDVPLSYSLRPLVDGVSTTILGVILRGGGLRISASSSTYSPLSCCESSVSFYLSFLTSLFRTFISPPCQNFPFRPQSRLQLFICRL